MKLHNRVSRLTLAVLVLALLALTFPTALRVSAQPRVLVGRTMSSALDVFRTPNQQTFTLTHRPAPDGTPLVFVNGLLMLANEDYTIAGLSLTFTGQEIGDSPIIQVQYWTAN